jgi:predicted AAA+ superfamily ATPase
MLLESSAPDLGHQLENIVYLELRRRFRRVSIGKLDEKEVDFVAVNAYKAEDNPDGMSYFQVAASVLDSNTLARELSSLQKIKDNHPKYLLTLDDIPSRANHGGIIQLYLIDWLLEKAA